MVWTTADEELIVRHFAVTGKYGGVVKPLDMIKHRFELICKRAGTYQENKKEVDLGYAARGAQYFYTDNRTPTDRDLCLAHYLVLRFGQPIMVEIVGYCGRYLSAHFKTDSGKKTFQFTQFDWTQSVEVLDDLLGVFGLPTTVSEVAVHVEETGSATYAVICQEWLLIQ